MNVETLSLPIRWLIILHVAAGTAALLSFAIPLATRKGGRLHRNIGWLYVFAMLFVAASTFIIAPYRIWFDTLRTTSSQNFALFLFYIACFTLASMWYGLKCLKYKNRTEVNRSLSVVGPPFFVVGLGLVVQIIGGLQRDLLLIAFPIIGLFTSRTQLRYWLSVPSTRQHWWYAHMNGMFSACISTITAFLVTAVPRIFPGNEILNSPVLWFAPGVILGTILNRWTESYQKKFGDKVSAAN